MGCRVFLCIKSSFVITVPLIKVTFILCAFFSFYLFFVLVSLLFPLRNDYITVYFTLSEVDRDCSMFIVSVSRNAFWCNPHTQTNEQTRSNTHTHEHKERGEKELERDRSIMSRDFSNKLPIVAMNARWALKNTHPSSDRKWDRESQWTQTYWKHFFISFNYKSKITLLLGYLFSYSFARLFSISQPSNQQK